MITGLLVVAGIVLVVLSVVTGQVLLAYVALGLAVAAVLTLFLPRWLAAGASARARTQDATREKRRAGKRRPARKKRDVREPVAETSTNGPAADPVDAAVSVAAEAPVAAETPIAEGAAASRPIGPVLVVPGRHRYHVEGCEVLREHRSDRLSLDEALDEGFTPCTRCQPDGARRPQPQG